MKSYDVKSTSRFQINQTAIKMLLKSNVQAVKQLNKKLTYVKTIFI